MTIFVVSSAAAAAAAATATNPQHHVHWLLFLFLEKEPDFAGDDVFGGDRLRPLDDDGRMRLDFLLQLGLVSHRNGLQMVVMMLRPLLRSLFDVMSPLGFLIIALLPSPLDIAISLTISPSRTKTAASTLDDDVITVV